VTYSERAKELAAELRAIALANIKRLEAEEKEDDD
jgi:hypothetical protein